MGMVDNKRRDVSAPYIVMGGYSLKQTLYAFAAGLVAGLVLALVLFARVGCGAWGMAR